MHTGTLPLNTLYKPDLLSVGIVLAPCEAVQPVLKRQLQKVIKRDTVCSRLENVVWESFFEQSGTLYDMSRFQIALLCPSEKLAVYVCNLADGWISVFGNLVAAGAFDAYFFRATLAQQAPYKVFEMQGWRGGALERHLRVLQDEDGWSFLNKGDPLPFESPMQYKRRQIGARLDWRLLERYSEALGYRIGAVTESGGQCWRFWRNG